MLLQEHTFPAAISEGPAAFSITGCGKTGEEITAEFSTQDFLLIYVNKGSGELNVNIRAYVLFAGDFMVCRPNEIKSFEPTVSDGTEYYWFSFNGRLGPDIVSVLKLTAREKFFAGHDNEVIGMLDRVIDEQYKSEPNAAVVCDTIFVAAMALMSRIAIHALPHDQTKGYDKIAPALNAINSDCTSKTGVDEYAKMCNLSTSYFTHLFTKCTGYSPMEYKQIQRISIAKNLLSTTNLSVKEISNIIGFKDPLYFGRCFKQATGHTPSGYRAKK